MESGQVMVELVPPSRRASLSAVDQTVQRMARLIGALPRVDFLNVPEIINENHAGVPFYEKIDAVQFASALSSQVRVPAVVNKVTVHMPQAEFDAWLTHALDVGIRNVVLVGGNKSSVAYRGISVLQANVQAVAAGAVVGNICIPDRAGELERLVNKTRAGCSFFTTQILFESATLNALLAAYDAACREEGLRPACFFLCFAPVSEGLDLDYMAWLGARIPPEIEQRLRQHDGAGASVALAQQLYLDALTHAKDADLRVPIGINVEPISNRNLDWVEPFVRSLNGVRSRL